MKATKNKAVILGVLYNGVEKFIDEYFMSLLNQSYKKYDIWLFNDNLDKEIAKEHIQKFKLLNIKYIELDSVYKPAQIRELAIKKVKDRYDYIIFSDVDDFYSKNRIENSIKILQDNDFCYNNMFIVDAKGRNICDNPFFLNKSNPQILNSFEQLLVKNCCGLSNTAINLKRVNLDFLFIPENLIAADWWIFSVLLLKGYSGCFLADAYTYYRQHDSNLVGGLSILDEKQLKIGIKVKKEQYKALLQYYPSRYDSIIRKEIEDILELENKVVDRGYVEQYLNTVNNRSDEFMWWENIKLIREMI